MPRIIPDGQTCDYAIAQMARVSYGQGTKSVNEDKGLIRYLLRHNHTSPFEGVDFKLHMKMPIFIARQMIRHRTVSLNEISGRYSVMKDEFYIPENSQQLINKVEKKLLPKSHLKNLLIRLIRIARMLMLFIYKC